MKIHHPWKETANEKIYFMNMWHTKSDNGNWPAHDRSRPVYFQFFAPEAKSVRLAGDFNQWDPICMRQRENGWWSLLIRLPQGLHQYRFLVDGKPLLNSQAASLLNDEDDEPVSLIAVK